MLDALIAAARLMAERGWMPATAGNVSIRHPNEAAGYLISASGGSKARLTADDFLHFRVGLERVTPGARKPSAETPVHDGLYQRHAPGAVLHAHPLHTTLVAQRFLGAGEVRIAGWELIKALGLWNEGATAVLPIVPNLAFIPALADAVVAASSSAMPAVLVAGHGVYAWGATVDDAVRHIEAVEVLSQIVWEHLRLDGRWDGSGRPE